MQAMCKLLTCLFPTAEHWRAAKWLCMLLPVNTPRCISVTTEGHHADCMVMGKLRILTLI